MKKSPGWYKPDRATGWPIWFFAALIGYAAFLFAPQVFNDGDTYLHVATGEWILKHGSVPYADPFSYTEAGKPWVAHEWLSELIMAYAFHLSGWDGVAIIFAAATALSLCLLAYHLSRWLDWLPMIVTLIITASCISPVLLARPHILVLPILEMWTAGLLIARSKSKAPSLFLLPLMLLWANLHGSFFFGLALVGPFALEAMAAAGTQWRKAFFSWGLFGFGAIIASFITPYGLAGLLFPLKIMNMQHLSAISEWRSESFDGLEPVELALLVTLYVCMSRGVKIPMVRLLTLLALLHFGLKHVRLEMQMAVVSALALAEPLGKTFATAPVNPSAWSGKRSWLRIALFLTLAAVMTGLRLTHPIPLKRSDGITAPVTALDHVPQELLSKHVLNEDAFGSYMLYRGIPPFLDGRMDIYDDNIMGDYLQMMSPDPQMLKRIIQQFDIQWVIMATGTPIITVMDMTPGWQRLYADKVAVVYVKTKIVPR